MGKLLDRQAFGMIHLMLAPNVAFNIMNEKTAEHLMKALSNIYEKSYVANKVHTMRKLFNHKMAEGGASVVDATYRISELNVITT